MFNFLKSFVLAVLVLTTASFSLIVSAETKNILEVASSISIFSKFVTALKAASLDTTLTGAGPLTVLAPTDQAFAKLPAGVLSNLLLPDNIDTLKQILTYHVIMSSTKSELFENLSVLQTVEGSNVDIKSNGSDIVLNSNSKVVTPDILASNGIIHAIDTVLVPPSVELSKLSNPISSSVSSVSISQTNSESDNSVRTGGFSVNSGFGLVLLACISIVYFSSKTRSSKL